MVCLQAYVLCFKHMFVASREKLNSSFPFINLIWGWKDGSALMSMYCTYRGCEPHPSSWVGDSQLPVTTAPSDTSSLAGCRPLMYMLTQRQTQTHDHTHRETHKHAESHTHKSRERERLEGKWEIRICPSDFRMIPTNIWNAVIHNNYLS